MFPTSISYKQILKIALPISFSLLVPQISFLANAAFLGRVGATEMVINGLASIFYLLLNWVGYGLASGIMVVLSRRIGEQRWTELNNTMFNGIILSIITCSILICLSFLGMDLLYTHALDNQDLKPSILQYLHIKVWGLPFLMFTQLFNALFIALGRSKLLIWGAICSNAAIILLDYGLIFGNWGLPKLGVYGAAWASLIGEIVLAITTYLVYRWRGLHQAYPLFHKTFIDNKLIKNIIQVSIPLVLQYVFSIGGWQLFFIYVEHLGKSEVAISHVLRSVLGIVSVGTWSLASTCNTLVSKQIGAGKIKEVYGTVFKLMIISFAYTAIISTLLLILPEQILSIYTADLNLINLGLTITPILAASILVMCISTICFNAVVGTGNTWVNFAMESTTVILYAVFITYIIGHLRLPIHIAWTSEIFYWGVLLICSGGYLISGKWKGKNI